MYRCFKVCTGSAVCLFGCYGNGFGHLLSMLYSSVLFINCFHRCLSELGHLAICIGWSPRSVCVCVCVLYIYIYNIYIYVHAHTHTQTHTQSHVCVCLFVLYYMCVCVCVCVCVSVYTQAHVCAYIYIYIYKETEHRMLKVTSKLDPVLRTFI